ncbi:hypothetical protein ASPZODRAFT_20370 [Penicilliopsis zonata CBS 506.65]|uniref:non-specific serine/threonine protein kinase n=1 Tax=Penicilliopsis zonata CBS 506.65 TaxID=1073090 RepID=A0A1L9S606_9EURO|nr:hypothetical protein ASPZODRAFT_20370 [Penicilliopsis zonata CBS 506.65]OJJ42601.1 hypothetical protein ASPZODRAFT_20370 [Penicilliopsis zonata CBS 506.65]
MSTRHEDKYNWIEGVESLDKYTPGGYHPIMIGDLLHGRYRVVDKLGFGGYSTVWLAQDTSSGSSYVAVKIGIADSSQAEIRTLRVLSSPPGCNLISIPLDEFELHGPNGTHPCYTTLPARCNLREISFSRLFPLEVARALVGGITTAIAYTHSRGYIHGDAHLRNILVKLPSSFNQLSIEEFYEEYGEPESIPVTRCNGESLPSNVPAVAVLPLSLGKKAEEFTLSDAQILLSDWGEAFPPALEERRGKDCHTPLSVRPPEARFEPEALLSFSADIWTLATTVWEILGMKAIFSSEFMTAEELVAQQVDLLGLLPPAWWQNWDAKDQFFHENGQPKEGRYVWPRMDKAFEEGVQEYRQKRQMGEFSMEETTAILDLMRRMLTFQPDKRPTAEEVLNSEWMVRWVLPDHERSLQECQRASKQRW